MNDDYARRYATLELRPGASWSEIRKTYRALVRTWHPDRFAEGSEARRIAEEKTKEITRAYKSLADYYHRHGAVPVADTVQPAATAHPGAGVDEHHRTHPPDVDQAAAAGIVPNDAHPATERRRLGLRAVAGSALAALLIYLWLLDTPRDENTDRSAIDAERIADDTSSSSNLGAGQPSEEQRFMRGSKLGEVYAIQGVPTRTEDNVWYYGKSKVYFSNGSVTHWEAHPDNPLKTMPSAESEYRHNLFITRGSSKREVLAIQGVPWHQGKNEWYYGSSRIFFDNDRVIGWEESPLNPLRIESRERPRPADRQR